MALSGTGVNVGVPHVPVSSGLPLKVVVKLISVSELPAPALVLCVEELVWDVVGGRTTGEVADEVGSQKKPFGTVIWIAAVGEVAAASVNTEYLLVHSDDKQYEFTILVASIIAVLLPLHCCKTQYST